MAPLPTPPNTYRAFVQRYPKLSAAWEAIASAGAEGPLGQKTARLIKLAVACGALREGAVHANVRKALAVGITREESTMPFFSGSRNDRSAAWPMDKITVSAGIVVRRDSS